MNRIESVSLGELLRLERRPVKVVADNKYAEIGIYSFGRGIFHKAPRSGLEVGDKDLFLIKEGDFILQVTFAWEGAVALASAAEDGMFGSTRFPTFRVTESVCHAPYLVNYFRTAAGRDQLVKISPGSAGRNRVLSLKRIPEVIVPLPPLAEQRRIVARIEELAAQIEEASKLRREAAVEAGGLVKSAIDLIFPKIITLASLGDVHVCRLVCGQHLGPEDQAEQGIPYMTGPADFGDRTAKPTRFARVARATAEPGDVLLTVKGAGVGKVNLAPELTTAIGRQLFALRPHPNRLDQVFLFYVLQFGLQHFREAITATTVPGIGREDVENLKIPCPSIQDQRRIVADLDALQSQVDALNRLQSETAAELDALLPSILDRAFKGEL